MAEEMFMFAVTAGIFAFLVALLFGIRRRHKKRDINKHLTYPNGMGRGLLQGAGQTWLAFLIIGPAFVLISIMLWKYSATINDALSKIPEVTTADADTISTLTGFYRESNQSNQNMFALMTAVFGAWVGSVVAFYFGTKSLAKTQDSLENVVIASTNAYLHNKSFQQLQWVCCWTKILTQRKFSRPL